MFLFEGDVMDDGQDNRSLNLKIPGDLLSDKPIHSLYGYVDKGKTYATVIGMYRKKFIPLEGIYQPKIGDLIVGVVTDVKLFGYSVFVNLPYDTIISARSLDHDFELDYGDIITATVASVSEVKSITLSNPRKLRGGRVFDVPPVKVPRILGKNNSMITLIKQKTGCNIIVGHNGLVWIGDKGNVPVAIRAIYKVAREAHMSGLTNRMERWLDEEISKTR